MHTRGRHIVPRAHNRRQNCWSHVLNLRFLCSTQRNVSWLAWLTNQVHRWGRLKSNTNQIHVESSASMWLARQHKSWIDWTVESVIATKRLEQESCWRTKRSSWTTEAQKHTAARWKPRAPLQQVKPQRKTITLSLHEDSQRLGASRWFFSF